MGLHDCCNVKKNANTFENITTATTNLDIQTLVNI